MSTKSKIFVGVGGWNFAPWRGAFYSKGFANLFLSGRGEYAMSKAIAVLGSALFFVIAPLVLAGFVPWWVTQREFRPAFFGVDLTRILGGILIIVGVPGVVDSFARFALEGAGPARPDRAATKARSDWPLSLRAKSDLHRGRRGHFWSGPFVW